MKNTRIRILIFMILAFVLVFSSSCSKSEDDKDLPASVDTKIEKEALAENNSNTEKIEKPVEEKQSSTSDKAVALNKPVVNQKPVSSAKPKVKVCTVSIECGTILSNMENLTEGKETLVPDDGIILGATEVEIKDGESVFDILNRVTKDNKIHMEFVNTPAYKSSYIEGINNLYEFDCGPLSGWMYKVNDWFPNYGCSKYVVEDGDVIKWIYSCDLGRDIGGEGIVQ